MNISGIILAAGESNRMGTPKQLLPYGEKTVIETVVDNFLQADLYEVIVVLGCYAEQIKVILDGYTVNIAINEKYNDGMLSSIQCGIRSASKSTNAFVIGLCDQPFIPSSIIHELLKYFISQEKGIVIPSYKGRRGHPIIIHCKYRDEILQLDSNIGLRQLMQNNINDISIIEVASDTILRDMDFPEDYERELRVLRR